MSELAIQFAARGQAELVELGAPPAPAPDQVLIRTRYSGITNGTERHMLLADVTAGAYPSRHGYQQVGVIEQVGERVLGFAPGDWVYYGQYVGHRAWNLVTVATADTASYQTHLVQPLPAGVEPAQCALLGVAGVAMRHIRRLRLGAGDNVWVVGLGPIGQFAAQIARDLGARVTVSDVDARRLALARALGASTVVDARDEAASAEQLAAAGPFDQIVDTAGREGLFQQILQYRLLAPGGAIGALAMRGDIHCPWTLLHGLEASIEVSCHFGLADLRLLLEMLQRGALQIAPLITHRVPVAEASRIYELMRDCPSEMLGVVFDWTA